MSWQRIKDAWSDGWRALAVQAEATYAAAVRANPAAYADRVRGFVAVLTEARATLDRIRGKLPSPPSTEADQNAHASWQALERRWHDLAAGFYADAQPVTQPAVGLPPAVMIVGAVAVGVAGIAWAVAAYQYAVNLRDQTALAEKELDARIAASREGRTLPPTTLPPPPATGGNVGLWLLGGLAVVAGALVIPPLLTK